MHRLFTIFILLTCCFVCNDALAQERTASNVQPPDTLQLNILPLDSIPADTAVVQIPLARAYIIQDARIDYLLEAHREAVQAQMGLPGYRIHLYMDAGNRARLNTQRERAEFEDRYPDVRAYVVYEAPYFKLRVGDFRTRLDARRFLERVRRQYPGAYIVRDQINFPDLETQH